MFLEALEPKNHPCLPLPALALWKPHERPPEELQALTLQLVEQVQAQPSNLERFKTAMEELVYFYLREDCKLNQCLAFLKLLDLPSLPQAAECFVDVLWLFGTQIRKYDPAQHSEGLTAKEQDETSKWNSLCTFVQAVASQGVVSPNMMKLSLETELLLGSKLFSIEPKTLHLRFVKLNTNLFYNQQKYNLLREETEGYSKLFAVINSLPPTKAGAHIENVKSLIGFFDLEPNRVLDIVLDVYEQNLWNPSFLELITMFRRTALPHILGFKFMYYGTPGDGTKKEEEGPILTRLSKSPPPASLYRLVVILIVSGLLSLEDLVPYLSPDVASMRQSELQYCHSIEESVKKYNKVSLNARGDTVDTKSDSPAVVEGDRKAEVIDDDPYAPPVVKGDWEEKAQLLGILTAALELRVWSIASMLLDMLVSAGIDPCRYESTSKALLNLITWRTNDLYTSTFSRSVLALGAAHVANEPTDASMLPNLPAGICCEPIRTLAELPKELSIMLSYVRHHIGMDVNLYFRLSRLVASYVKSLAVTDKDKMDLAPQWAPIEQIISNSLLPGLQCIGFKPALAPDKWEINTNPPAAFVLWEAVEWFPYSVRYRMYDIWKGDRLGKDAIDCKHIELVRIEDTLLTEIKNRMKRLSKENVKSMGRHLAKSIHSNPVVVATRVISYIESYDNMIQILVDALRYANPLALDVIAWSIIKQLNGDRAKMQADGQHYEKWLSSVATFTGAFFRKYPQVDLTGLLTFLVDQLSKGESLDLLVLKELLNKMGGCETTMMVGEDALECLAGGTTLRTEGLNLTEKDNLSKKAVKQLRTAMLRDDIALRFLVLLSKNCNSVLFTCDTKHIKLMAHLSDVCQEVLTLFIEFIITPTPNTLTKPKDKEKVGQDKEIVDNLLKLLPSFKELNNEMRLGLPVLFTVARPLFRAALLENQDPTLVQGPLASWHPLSESVIQSVRAALPPSTWNFISPVLYVMFWSLSLYDIHYPKEQYDLQIARVKGNITRLEQRASENTEQSKDTRKELTAANLALTRLKAEMKEQSTHVERIKSILINHRDQFIPSTAVLDDMDSAIALHQFCLLPRLRMSPWCAWFCPKFVFLLHKFDTPQLSTLNVLNKMVNLLGPLAYCTTEYEAQSLGFVLKGMFEVVNTWCDSPKIYNSDVRSKRGMFFIQSQLEHSQFKQVYKKWHNKLTKIIMNCVTSDEFMHIRSALVMLKVLIPVFPTRKSAGTLLETRIGKLGDDERADIKLLATGVNNQLKKRWDELMDDVSTEKGANKGLSEPSSGVDAQADKSVISKVVAEQAGKVDSRPEAKGPTPSMDGSNANPPKPGRIVTVEEGQVSEATLLDRSKRTRAEPTQTAARENSSVNDKEDETRRDRERRRRSRSRSSERKPAVGTRPKRSREGAPVPPEKELEKSVHDKKREREREADSAPDNDGELKKRKKAPEQSAQSSPVSAPASQAAQHPRPHVSVGNASPNIPNPRSSAGVRGSAGAGTVHPGRPPLVRPESIAGRDRRRDDRPPAPDRDRGAPRSR